MKKTFKDLFEIRNTVIIKYGEVKENEFKSKVEYALKKWITLVDGELSKIQKKYSEEFASKKEDLEVQFAIEIEEKIGDKTIKKLLKNEKGEFQYNKEDTLKLKQEMRQVAKEIDEACNAQEIEFIPYLIDSEMVEETDEEVIAKLKGVFFK
jgi:hypothetical protein